MMVWGALITKRHCILVYLHCFYVCVSVCARVHRVHGKVIRFVFMCVCVFKRSCVQSRVHGKVIHFVFMCVRVCASARVCRTECMGDPELCTSGNASSKARPCSLCKCTSFFACVSCARMRA